ncbi:hypothetical protein ONZ51_g814 [Trametes cubensis]|uniref:Uncharacterized protein n=1 Tax=Trametes cubensis TaxID=1111947 RepID=A0AAD7XIB3_9APHY|nr:hypothetical protein ONZ51_g814 [Trametes cubensis]
MDNWYTKYEDDRQPERIARAPPQLSTHPSPSVAVAGTTQTNHGIQSDLFVPTPVTPSNNITVIVNVFDKDNASQVLNVLPDLIHVSSSSRHGGSSAMAVTRSSVVPFSTHTTPIISASLPGRPSQYVFPVFSAPPQRTWPRDKKRRGSPGIGSGSKRRRTEAIEVSDDMPSSAKQVREMDMERHQSPRDMLLAPEVPRQTRVQGAPRRIIKRSESEAIRDAEEIVHSYSAPDNDLDYAAIPGEFSRAYEAPQCEQSPHHEYPNRRGASSNVRLLNAILEDIKITFFCHLVTTEATDPGAANPRAVERSLATDPAVGPNNGSGHVNLNPSLSNIQLTLYVASPALAPPTRIPQHRAVTEIGPSQQLPPPVATRCATNELRFQQGAPIPTTPRYSQTQRVARPTPPLPRTATPSAHQTTGRLRPVAQWSGTHRGDNLNEESESDSTDEDTYA